MKWPGYGQALKMRMPGPIKIIDGTSQERLQPYGLGELRVLTDDVIDSFSRAVFRVAALLRKHDDLEGTV